MPLLLALLLALGAGTAQAAAAPSAPRPLVLSVLQQGQVDADVVQQVSGHLQQVLERDPQLIVSVGTRVCLDEVCAQGLAAPHGLVVYGVVDLVGPLFVVDLHLFDAEQGTAARRARLEAPEVSILKKQIDEAAVLLLGGEPPPPSLSPWLLVGGIGASVGALALGAGSAGLGWNLWVQNDPGSSAQSRVSSEAVVVPAWVAVGVGAVLVLAGVVVVGAVVEE